MRIQFEIKSLKQFEACEDFKPANEKSPLFKLQKAILEQLVHHPDFQDAQVIGERQLYEPLDLPEAEGVKVIEVVFCKYHADIPLMLDITRAKNQEAPLGWFATSSGLFDTTLWFTDKFRVIVGCDERYLKEYFRFQRNQQMFPDQDQYDLNYLLAPLNTITHELAHAVEFIRHGAGLTPAEVELAVEDGEVDFTMFSVISGQGIRPDIPLSMEQAEAEHLMESRVENQGYSWLKWALERVPFQLQRDCLDAYVPKA